MNQSTRIRRLGAVAIKKRQWQAAVARAGRQVVLLESEEIELREGCTHRDGHYKPLVSTNGIDTWCTVCGVVNTASVLMVAGHRPGLAKARPRLQLVCSTPTIEAEPKAAVATTRL